MAVDLRRRVEDPALVARVQAGDAAALALLTARYAAVCARWARYSGLDPGDAAQIAWLALYQAARTWVPGSQSFLAYATLLVRRRLATAQRTVARREAWCDLLPAIPDGAALVGAARARDPAEIVLARLALEPLIRLLRITCTPLERAVVAAIADGWTVAEVAAVLGRRKPAVERILHRARAKLRPKLHALGLGPPAAPPRARSVPPALPVPLPERTVPDECPASGAAGEPAASP